MSDINDTLNICDESWQRVKDVYELSRQLKELELWLAADKEGDKTLLNGLHDILDQLDYLYRLMVDWQVQLLMML